MRRRHASVGDVPRCRYIPETGQIKPVQGSRAGLPELLGRRAELGTGSVEEPGALRAPPTFDPFFRFERLVDTPWFVVLTVLPMGVA